MAAGRCADLTSLVYRRLFEIRPEIEACSGVRSLIWSKINAGLRRRCDGDFAGDHAGRFRPIGCEALSQDTYGPPAKCLGNFSG
jgi:hypothetical protein